MRRVAIPRKVLNLWIMIRMVARGKSTSRGDRSTSRIFPRNMQESIELILELLLLVALLIIGGCLKNRRFDKYACHSHYLSLLKAIYSQGYPQKVGSENFGINILDSLGY